MKIKLLLLGALSAMLCISAKAQTTATITTAGSGTPPVGAGVQFLRNTSGGHFISGAPEANNYIAGDNHACLGQSFTTGNNAAGYKLNSISVEQVVNGGTFGATYYANNSGTLGYRVFTLSGSTIGTVLATESAISVTPNKSAGSYNPAGANAWWVTVTFATPITLAANTKYAFDFQPDTGIPSSPPFYMEWDGTNAVTMSGGQAFADDSSGGVNGYTPNATSVTLLTGERVFVANMAAVGAPSVTAVANPANPARGQTFTITATVTPSVGTVTNVSVDLSAIGGSSAAPLVLSATANVYTNTFTVSSGAALGAASLSVSAKDTTPLTGSYGLALTVLPANDVWTGGSVTGNTWSDSANWLGNVAPLAGDALTFAGTTRPTPDMNDNYSVSGLVFSNTAGSFTIGSSTGSTLTSGSGGIVNNSANAQTLNVPIILGAAQTFSTVGSLTLNSNVTGGVDLTTTGAGTFILASAGTNTLGNLRLASGQMNITAGTVNVSDSQGSSTRVESNATLVVSGGTLNIVGSNVLNGWFPIGVTAGATGVVTVAGGTINVNDHWGTEIGNESGAGILNINSGTFINNDAGGIGFLVGETGSAGGTVNLNGGTLIINKIVANAGGSFFFNGGTLKPVAANAAFWNNLGTLTASIRDGGAVVDTAGFNVTIGQPLLHSTVTGDNATDGGLTKTGNGILTLTSGYQYTGPNKVLGGTLNLNLGLGVASSGGDLVVSNATLTLDASSGTVMPAANVLLNSGAILNFMNYPYGNAVNGTGNLLVGSNTVLNLNYGSLGGNNPSAAAINVAGSMSVTGTNNVINIIGSSFTAGQCPLIKYNSGTLATISGFALGSLPVGVNAVLTNNTANQSVDLNITFIGQTLTWYGADSSGNLLPNWNINTSFNWNGGGAKYLEYNTNTFGDFVTFDDNLYNQQSTNVILTSAVHPSQIIENSSLPYSFTGAGSIAGAGSLIMNGSGSLTLGTANSYTGGTFLNAGTLVVSNSSALGASSSLLTLAGGKLQVAGNMAGTPLAAVTANSTVDVLTNITGQLKLNGSAGGGSLTKIDNGILTLSSAGASGLGDLIVSQGLLKVTNGTVIASATQGNSKIDTGASVEVDAGGTLTINNGVNAWFPLGDSSGTTNTLTISGGTVNIADNWGIEVPRQGNAILTINSGSMTVNDIGGIGLILGDMNTAESGTLNLNGGTLLANKITSNNGTNAFYFNGGTLKPVVAGMFFPSSATLSTEVRNGGAIVDTAGLNVSIAEPLDHSQVPGDNATDGGLTKTGNGTMTLTATNTYTGGTVVNGGAIQISTENQLGVVPASPAVNITLNGGSIYNNNSTPSLSTNRTISLGASGGYLQAGWGPSQGLIVNGQITGAGGLGINWDSGWVTLNAVNNYQGNTTIGTNGPAYWNNGGANPTLRLGVDNALPYGASAGNVLFGTNANNNTATLDLNGHNTQINGLTGDINATIDNTVAGAYVLTVGNNNQGSTFGGVIKNTSGTVSLIKTGNGTLVLSGANAYTGNTTVNGGILAIGQATLATNSTVTVASGAKLQLDFAATNMVTALVLNGVSQPGGVYNSNTSPAYITGAGSLIVPTTGPGTFTNPPGITSFTLNGANVVISGANGQAGDAYYLLESTNVALPLSQWTTVATNVLGANGAFTFTGTNVVTPGSQQQFYILSNTNSNH